MANPPERHAPGTVYRDIPDARTLEREYSPSSCIDDLPARVQQYSTRSAAARNDLACVTRSYGGSADAVLDIFVPPDRPASGPARPALVYLHGGYWQELGKDDHSFLAPGLLAQGRACVVVNYGLAPEVRVDEMVDRCAQAVEWLAANACSYGIDALDLHLAGSSAGAHLASMVALRRAPVASLTLLSGVFDLRPITRTYVNGPLRLSDDEAILLSPLFLADTADGPLPPTLLAHGSNETEEFKRQSRDMAAALRLRGADVSLVEVPGRDHFDLVYDLAEPTASVGAWLANRTPNPDRPASNHQEGL